MSTMSAVIFDTHVFIKKLIAVGMPERQAEVLAEEQTHLIENKIATKRDLEEFQTLTKLDLEEHRSATKRDLQVLEVKLEAKITHVKAEVVSDLVKWLIGVSAAQATLILAALHFFH